ncbi:hypothetical protein OpiT1DRAFT_03793 [Opitutaceae bacterium TAV1]|nr:hypothetical protein OpiT1DRAFT_03782 [Opitutaceae bacterium TAV1]EIP99280.1 hypothetical protein OpiT1DRAFT_03793 [Opitutaceae bacterium TAV1]
MSSPDRNSNLRSDDPDGFLDEQEPGFFRRYGPVLATCLVAAGGIAWWLVSTASGPKPSAPKPQEFSMVRIALPPPPPPPPPQQRPEETPKPEETQQQMIEQEPVAADEPRPAETPQPAAEESAAPMGTNIQGDGPPDGFGLTGRGNGGIIGGTGTGNGAGSGGRGSSRWGWYAAQIQTTVSSALGKNPKTRAAAMDISVRIWPDAAGRIERAQLVTSTGDREIDDAIRDEVLTGLILREPPPSDMPSPIVLRLTGSRP